MSHKVLAQKPKQPNNEFHDVDNDKECDMLRETAMWPQPCRRRGILKEET